MEKILLNLSALIRFSKLDKDFVLTKDEIEKIKTEKRPYHISFDDVLIIFYGKGFKKSTGKDMIQTAQVNKTKKLIMVKPTWSKSNDVTTITDQNIRFITYADLEYNIIPMIRTDIYKVDESDLEFYNIDKNNLPKILYNDILAKWLLLDKGDIIKYNLYTENGKVLKMRICI